MRGVSHVLLLLSLSSTSFQTEALVLSESCECVGWQDAYNSHGADCGNAGGEVCALFFKKLPNERFCVNEDVRQPAPKQWCYVSPSCQNGLALTWNRNPTEAKFKWCIATDDAKLADKTPLELNDWSAANNLLVGLVVHFAYPTWPGKFTTDILKFYSLKRPSMFPPESGGSSIPLSDEYRGVLQKRADEGTATLVIPTTGHSPYGIMKGKELYWVNFLVDPQPGPVTPALHKKQTVKCVAGCEEDKMVAPWMSFVNNDIRDDAYLADSFIE